MAVNQQDILAQNDAPERATRRRWLVTLSTVPLLGMVAAFGIAPPSDIQQVEIQPVVESLALPVAREESLGNFWQEERIQRGDTIASLLNRLNVRDEAAVNYLRNARAARLMYQLKPGFNVQARTSDDGQLISLRYVYSKDRQLLVERVKDGFLASERPLSVENRVLMRSGEIKTSLFAATDAANIPDPVATQLAEVFASEVDFHRELSKGDRFTVVYEAAYSNGQAVRPGRLLAAEFINNGEHHQAVFFRDREGHEGYYTPDGRSLRKAFLRSPIEFSRISSGFSNARFHPVLQTIRAHRGVDYAAPIGTRIKATADGVVARMGWENGYGNAVTIEHDGKYSTLYGHMSAFGPGLRQGARVTQGQVIGYVGMTGLASGPHLHYEFRIAGEQRDPLSGAMPIAIPVSEHFKADFKRLVSPLVARLHLLRTTNLALAE